MLKVVLLMLLFFSFTVWASYGQCNTDSNDLQCVEEITASNTLVKSYKLQGERTGDTEFSSVLVKDIRYYLNLCEQGQVSNNVVINVYDSQRKLVASNKESGRSVLTELSFICEKTGVYYFVFKKGSETTTCGLGTLSFRKE